MISTLFRAVPVSNALVSVILLQSLTDARVLVLAAIYRASVTARYGIVFFLPQMIKGLGQSNLMTGLLTAIPYPIGVAGLLLWGHSSNRRHERRGHLIAAMAVAGIGLIGAAWLRDWYWAIAAMSIATVGIYGSRPSSWPMPSMFPAGAAAAAGFALIHSIGNLGGSSARSSAAGSGRAPAASRRGCISWRRARRCPRRSLYFATRATPMPKARHP